MDPNISALAAYPGKFEQKLFSTLFNSLDRNFRRRRSAKSGCMLILSNFDLKIYD